MKRVFLSLLAFGLLDSGFAHADDSDKRSFRDTPHPFYTRAERAQIGYLQDMGLPRDRAEFIVLMIGHKTKTPASKSNRRSRESGKAGTVREGNYE